MQYTDKWVSTSLAVNHMQICVSQCHDVHLDIVTLRIRMCGFEEYMCYAYIHIRIHASKHAHIHRCTHIYTPATDECKMIFHAYMDDYMYVYMSVSVYVCMSGCMDATCMYARHMYYSNPHIRIRSVTMSKMDIVALRTAYLHVVNGEGGGDPFVRVLHRFVQSVTSTIV